MGTIRTHFLDASAIVKLLINEIGSDKIRKYFTQHSCFYTTSLCFAEALGVLKAKHFHQKEITEEEYLAASDLLMAYIAGESIGIVEIEIKQRCVFREVENLVQKYSIDISDAFQIYTLKKGFLSSLEGDASPILITGDCNLAKSADKEGLKVWDCVKDTPP